MPVSEVKASKKLIRMISSRGDIALAIESHALFKLYQDLPVASHLFESMVIAYGRPFFKSTGVGRLQCDYPEFPDFTDESMNERHRRFIDLRNKFIAHSSIEGTRIMVVPPGVINPLTGELRDRYDQNIGKRKFYSDPSYADWLIEVAVKLKSRLDTDVENQMVIELANAPKEEAFELVTGFENFKWTDKSSEH